MSAAGADPDNALVEAWDDAQRCPPWQRPAVLVAVLSAAPLDDAPVGVVARRALEVAESWFGPEVHCLFACRTCGEPMEASLAVAELLARAPGDDPGPFPVEVGSGDGATLVVRLPRPADVAATAAAGSPADALRVLLERTVVDAPAGLDVLAHAEEVSAACEARDPLGVVSVEVVCPACGAADMPLLDVAQWCWAIVDAHVRRLLDEVHLLASAYGWSEQEILALGPYRRAVYLEAVA